jgi:hypothetical protein
MIRRRLCCSIFLLLVALASCILLTSASGVDDEFEDNYHVNHADLAAAVEAELAAASSSSSSQLPREFSIRAGHRSAQDALQEYRAWHARTMADPEACAKAEALVWSAQAVSAENARIARTS